MVTAQQSSSTRTWGQDPATAFRYYVEMKSVIEGAFTECSGLGVEREIKQWKEGGLNDHVHLLPGRAVYTGNLVLKRGITYSDALWDWFQEGVHTGTATPVELAIILVVNYNIQESKRKAIRWNVESAFPVKWLGPTLNSGNSEAAVETIEIAHQGLKMTFE